MATGILVFFSCTVLAFLLTPSTISAVKIPTLDSTSMNLTYSIGKNAELRCTVADLGRNTITWRRLSDPVPISIGTTKFTPSKKYRVTYDKTTRVWTLFIKKLGHEDAGEYECRVTGVDGASKTLSLIMPGRHNTYIEPTDSIIEADPGERVMLPCVVNNLKKHKVLWVDDRGVVLSFRKKVLNGDGRLRLVHTSREEWSLQIRNINEEDYGTYTCLVNTDPVITRTITLKSSGPPRTAPKFDSGNHIRDVKVNEGEPVTLACNFLGYPEPKVSWSGRLLVGTKRVKKTFSFVGTTFKILSATPGDTGNYTCTGKNGVSPVSRGKVRLTVVAKPTEPPPKTTPADPIGLSAPVVYTEIEEVGERKGVNVYLTCHSVGNPTPSMYWKWRDSTLASSWKYRIFTTDSGPYRRQSQLRINHLGTTDYGHYECFAHNNQGHVGTRVRLYETFL